jgi:hypothetical protein
MTPPLELTPEERIALTQRANLTPEEKIQLTQQRRIATARTRKHRRKVAAELAQQAAEEKQTQDEFDLRRVELRLCLPNETEPFARAAAIRDALQVAREFLQAYGQPDVQRGESLIDVERRVCSVWQPDRRLLNRNSLRLDSDRIIFEGDFDSLWELLPKGHNTIDVATLPTLPPMLPAPVTVLETMTLIKKFRAQMARRREAVNPSLPINIDIDVDQLAINVAMLHRLAHESGDVDVDVIFEYDVKRFWYLDLKYYRFDQNDPGWRERAAQVRSYNTWDQELIRRLVTNEIDFSMPSGASPAVLPEINYTPSPLNVGYLSSVSKRKRDEHSN